MAADDVFGIVGTVQAGAFRVEECVAEGGFAVVYRAYHDGFRANIALKCLKIPGSLKEEGQKEFLAKFREEAELLFRLSSMIPNIVRPLHVGTLERTDDKFVPFIAIEWLEGCGLDQLIAARRDGGEPPLTLTRTLELLTPVAEALDRAHKFPAPDGFVCIVHRDLKPENIFIANLHGQEVPKILDFGIAKVKSTATQMVGHQSLTPESLSAFTPAYGAPEQWFPKSYGQTGPWTDVWGLALTAAECLCGHTPISDDLDPAAMMGCAIDPVRRPTPRKEGAPVSDEVEAVFIKALAVDPKDRYHDIATFWSELMAAAGEPLLAQAPANVFQRRGTPFGSSPSNPEPSSPVASNDPPQKSSPVASNNPPQESSPVASNDAERKTSAAKSSPGNGVPAVPSESAQATRKIMPSLQIVDSEYPPPAKPARKAPAPISPTAHTVPRFRSRAASGPPWGVIALGTGVVLAAGGVFLGRGYFENPSATAPTPSVSASVRPEAAHGGRVAELVGRAEERLAFGDLEGAKEQLDRAAALSDKNATVLVGLARIEAIRADVHWLMRRLVAEDDRASIDSEQKKLDARLPKLSAAIATAERASPTDPGVLRARVDALRIAGDTKRAEELSTRIAWETTNPETAYVLAALDMVESSPPWQLIIERLRRAASLERGPGRARAALVYALAESGDVDTAKRELDRFSRGDPHPLERPLRAFLERRASSPDGGTSRAFMEAKRTEPKNAEAATSPAEKPRKGGEAATGKQRARSRVDESGSDRNAPSSHPASTAGWRQLPPGIGQSDL